MSSSLLFRSRPDCGGTPALFVSAYIRIFTLGHEKLLDISIVCLCLSAYSRNLDGGKKQESDQMPRLFLLLFATASKLWTSKIRSWKKPWGMVIISGNKQGHPVGIIVAHDKLLAIHFPTLIVDISRRWKIHGHSFYDLSTLKMGSINSIPTSFGFFFNEPLQSYGLSPVMLDLKKTWNVLFNMQAIKFRGALLDSTGLRPETKTKPEGHIRGITTDNTFPDQTSKHLSKSCRLLV